MILPTTVLHCISGRSTDFVRSTPNADGSFGGVYTGNEIITFTVCPEDSEVAVLTQVGAPNAWVDATSTTWIASLTDAQTATLAPGVYDFEVTAPIATAGRTGTLFEGKLEVFASAGNVVPNNLISAYYAGKLLASTPLTPEEWQSLPDLIMGASGAIRSWCNRFFTQNTYTEIVPVIDGRIRLRETPINWISRAQARPRVALTISNTSADAAWIGPASTGDVYVGITTTGLVLSSLTNGSLTTTTVGFTANETINGLATAINAVSGWSATSNLILGALPVTEIYDVLEGKGAGLGNSPNTAAQYRVFASGIANPRPYSDDGQRTGNYIVGNQYGDVGPSWGPGWQEWEDSPNSDTRRVKVTYNGGFATIPREIQLATAELVKYQLSRLKSDPTLQSENAADYSYQLKEQVDALPRHVLQALSRYRNTNA